MKTTYLLREIQPDGSIQLVETSSENWHAIVKADAKLPRRERRFFIYDVIAESNGLDCLVIEVTWEVWREWDNEQRRTRRNNLLKKQYEHLSVDALCDDESDHSLKSKILKGEEFEMKALGTVALEELRLALSSWKSWGPTLLDYYIAGENKSCTNEFASNYGVSEQVARKYKRQFEKFVKDFFA